MAKELKEMTKRADNHSLWYNSRHSVQKIILILICVIATAACSSEEKEEATIAVWDLKSFDKGWQQTKIFNAGEVRFVFYNNGNAIIKNNTAVDLKPLTCNQVVPFDITQNHIIINFEVFNYVIDGNRMYISQNPTSDGVNYTFSRVN